MSTPPNASPLFTGHAQTGLRYIHTRHETRPRTSSGMLPTTLQVQINTDSNAGYTSPHLVSCPGCLPTPVVANTDETQSAFPPTFRMYIRLVTTFPGPAALLAEDFRRRSPGRQVRRPPQHAGSAARIQRAANPPTRLGAGRSSPGVWSTWPTCHDPHQRRLTVRAKGEMCKTTAVLPSRQLLLHHSPRCNVARTACA